MDVTSYSTEKYKPLHNLSRKGKNNSNDYNISNSKSSKKFIEQRNLELPENSSNDYIIQPKSKKDKFDSSQLNFSTTRRNSLENNEKVNNHFLSKSKNTALNLSILENFYSKNNQKHTKPAYLEKCFARKGSFSYHRKNSNDNSQ